MGRAGCQGAGRSGSSSFLQEEEGGGPRGPEPGEVCGKRGWHEVAREQRSPKENQGVLEESWGNHPPNSCAARGFPPDPGPTALGVNTTLETCRFPDTAPSHRARPERTQNTVRCPRPTPAQPGHLPLHAQQPCRGTRPTATPTARRQEAKHSPTDPTTPAPHPRAPGTAVAGGAQRMEIRGGSGTP